MERRKRRRYIQQFLELTEQEQQSILSLFREMETALALEESKSISYHRKRPIKRTIDKLLQ